MTQTSTATIWRENDGYVALCPELDIASQGDSIEDARANLKEAAEGLFELADRSEIESRLNREIYISPIEVAIGGLRRLSGREICAILSRHGFVQVRQRGSYIYMQLSSAETTITVPVPDHREVRIGTLLSIIR